MVCTPVPGWWVQVGAHVGAALLRCSCGQAEVRGRILDRHTACSLPIRVPPSRACLPACPHACLPARPHTPACSPSLCTLWASPLAPPLPSSCPWRRPCTAWCQVGAGWGMGGRELLLSGGPSQSAVCWAVTAGGDRGPVAQREALSHKGGPVAQRAVCVLSKKGTCPPHLSVGSHSA